jgi:hypothetical protein
MPRIPAKHLIVRNSAFKEFCQRFYVVLLLRSREKEKAPCKLTILSPCNE